MPSQPFDTGWDFSPVLDLIDSDLHDVGSPTLVPTNHAFVRVPKDGEDRRDDGPVRLGSFTKLWEQLGIPDDGSLPSAIPPIEPESDDLSNSDDALLSPAKSSRPLAEVRIEEHRRARPVQPTKPDSSGFPKTSESSRPLARTTQPSTTSLVQSQLEDSSNSDGAPNFPRAGNSKDVQCTHDVFHPSPSHSEVGNEAVDPYAGMSKKQRHQARKRAEKERKAQKQLQKKHEQYKEKKEQEHVRHEFLTLAAETSTANRQSNELATRTSRTQSRSDVGAEVGPTTLVHLDPVFLPEVTAAPDARDEHILASTESGSRPLNSSAKPFRSGSTEHVPQTPQPPSNAEQVCQPIGLESAIKMQYTTSGTPLTYGYQFQSILSQQYVNGYAYTPVFNPPMYGLIPRTVQPVTIQRTPQIGTPQVPKHPILPAGSPTFTIRPKVDRHLHFFNQLVHNFPEEKSYLVAPMQLCRENVSTEGIHVFVDASNIMIGFKEMLRVFGVQPFELSFDSLALLMERRRPVAKRVYAGSHREASPLPDVAKLVETSKAVGYENNIKEQVYIRREETEKKKFFKEVKRIGWNKAVQRRSGTGSDSDSEMGPRVPSTPSAPKWVEQGVDEILHLKMCQSIIDIEVPTTMVLATGDGAEAEHSDGFLAHVERALRKGWNVELVSWKEQTSGGYKNKRFRTKWGDQFRIIELDEYLESLIDTQ